MMNRHRPSVRALVWAAVAAVALLVSAAGVVILVVSAVGVGPPGRFTADEVGRPAAVQADAEPGAWAADPAPGLSVDTRGSRPGVAVDGALRLDPLSVTAPVVPATVPGGVLTPPQDVSTVGIWTDGAPLHAASGTTVLAGHVNLAGHGAGALHDLHVVQPGELVHTVDHEGNVDAWRVTAVTERPKTSGVDESIWDGLAGPRRLVVVTCGGDLEYAGGRGDYQDNVYLYAEPAQD